MPRQQKSRGHIERWPSHASKLHECMVDGSAIVIDDGMAKRHCHETHYDGTLSIATPPPTALTSLGTRATTSASC